MPRLPTGTVTFLFTDIEESTRLLRQLGEGKYAELLADQRRLLRTTFQAYGGREVDTQGDAFFYAFPRARDTLEAAISAQRAIAMHPWPSGITVQVRIGIHTGEPLRADTGYVGMDVHRAARICAAGHGGQILLSGITHELIADDLPQGVSVRDLGVHRLKDLTRPQHLFQLVAEGLPADFPPLKSLDVLPNNLPVQVTSFVGREREMADVKQLLSLHRLVTLTGAGGSGKTRLALQVAADLLDAFPDGVWLVDLSSLADPSLMPQVTASALRVREEPRRTITDTLFDALRDKSMLLLLDNCEHLLAACVEMTSSLLQAATGIRILATSREVLKIPGEIVRMVPPLTLPDVQITDTVSLLKNEAVKLFLDRAGSVQPAFTLTATNAWAVVDICRQLDGIPLAIELAAARTSALTAEQIAARLNDRFRLLTGGGRAPQPRHRTLRAALDWSYDLLSAPEQALLRRLSTFTGGHTLEAAEYVCEGDPIAPSDVLDVLTRLVDKSLVLADVTSGDEARYRMLETIRQYAKEKLEAAGEYARICVRCRDWFLALTERAEPALRGAHQEAWLERLSLELDNLRAVMDWCRSSADHSEIGLRIAGALGMFWDVRGFLREGLQWTEDFLARAGHAPGSVRARALNWAATLAYRQGDYARVRTMSAQAFELGRAEGDHWNSALALHYLGHMAQVDGDFDAAARRLSESVDLFRAMGTNGVWHTRSTAWPTWLAIEVRWMMPGSSLKKL